MNKNQSRLNFATINPSDILFLSNHVQISRRKAVALTTSRERFLEAVYDSKLKASKKEAAKKSFEADKAEQEVLRQEARAERDQMIVDCDTCEKSVMMGYTRILVEKDRAKRVCGMCFKLRGEYLAKQREKEARIAADKAAEEWLNQMNAPAIVVQPPVNQPVINNTSATFNAPKGLDAIEEMLAAQVQEVETTEPKAKRVRKSKAVSAESVVTEPVKKPRTKKRPMEIAAA